MRTSSLKLANTFTAKENHKQSLAGVRVIDNVILATDTHRAVRITEKENSIHIPDSLNEQFPELTDKKVEVNLPTLYHLAKLAVEMTTDKKRSVIYFWKDTVSYLNEHNYYQEMVLKNPFELSNVKLNAQYLLSATKELMKRGFRNIDVEQKMPHDPFLMIAENAIEKIEIIIMPIK